MPIDKNVKTEKGIYILVRNFYNWFLQSLGSWHVIMLALALVIGHTGFWIMPNLVLQFSISQHLTCNPFSNPDAQYLFTNYLQPALFFILGGRTSLYYAIYVSVITVLFFVLFVLWFIKFHGKDLSLDHYKVVGAVTFPVFMVPFYWLGMDGMTLLLMFAIMFISTSKWAVLLGVLLAWQHFEQGLVAFVLLVGTIILHSLVLNKRLFSNALNKYALVIVGLLVGKLLLLGYFHILGIELSGNRVTWVMKYYPIFIAQLKTGWLYILWSLFGVGWSIIIWKIQRVWPICVAVIIAFVIIAIVADQTRVGTIILFPVLFYWVMMDKQLWKELDLKWLITLIVFYLVLPVVYFYGFPYGSLWQYDFTIIEQVIDGTFEASYFSWDSPFLLNK